MPVTVYTDSPIAAKPSGVTPQTAAPGPTPSSGIAPPATTTASSISHPGTYPQAQPGAGPSLPTPTAAAQAFAPRPAPTQPLQSQGPPPPQPGAVPVPPGGRANIPPPPKVGEKYLPPQQTATPSASAVPYPPQLSIPAPTASYPAQQQGTSTATGPYASSGHGGRAPTTLPGAGPLKTGHSPYQQDVHASGALDSYQRSAAFRNDTGGPSTTGQSTEGDIWGSAKKWAQATGEKLAAAENEVWKRINKE